MGEETGNVGRWVRRMVRRVDGRGGWQCGKVRKLNIG